MTSNAPNAIEHCPNCGAKDPGDPCRVCGQGRNVPTMMSWNDRMGTLERMMHEHPDPEVRRHAMESRRSIGIAATARMPVQGPARYYPPR